ncbi:MAG: hypothetical protein P4M08_08380 [Oligoflexia bacterium]|nr:hypothetical protein [Oligoflexia bacterium]
MARKEIGIFIGSMALGLAFSTAGFARQEPAHVQCLSRGEQAQGLNAEIEAASEGYTRARAIDVATLIQDFNSSSFCQELPANQSEMITLIDELNDQLTAGSHTVDGNTVWGPGGEPKEPPRAFFDKLTSCLDPIVKTNPDMKIRSHYAYLEGTVFGIDQTVYATGGERAFKLFQTSFQADKSFRPGLIAFTDSVASAVTAIINGGHSLSWAGWYLGTNFKDDVAELQASANALPASDPAKAALLARLAQTEVLIQSQ